MLRTTVSCCHSLKIIPVHFLKQFARTGSSATIIMHAKAPDAYSIPGTVQISTTAENGIISKKITFERSDVSVSTADILEEYKYTRLLATYIDESGLCRVCGSPLYPLSLEYDCYDGVFAVTLSGQDVKRDAFLRVQSPS